ncbi:MAG: PIG-L family deacetylase [Thermodesulfobacteriota bacterium]
MAPNEVFNKSVLIVAHPDDEVLWFSSVLEKVDEIKICYLDVKSAPKWTTGRRKSIAEYPKDNITCLGIDESEVFNDNNWRTPRITEYGLEILRKNSAYDKYRENYYKLKNELSNKLTKYRNVFTHNPWGEYGNEEHVQVYRVVKELKESMGFTLWFSNYCSNKSFGLVQQYISGFDSKYITLQTNKEEARKIKRLYQKNLCWTWYSEWEWFNEESFMEDENTFEGNNTAGHFFPLNMIKVILEKESKGKLLSYGKFISKMWTSK